MLRFHKTLKECGTYQKTDGDTAMPKLCPRGKKAAKAKFAVYPSAYANAYASKVCAGKIKGPGGKKRKDFRGPKPKAAGGGTIKLAKGGKTVKETTRSKMSTKPKPTVKEDTTFIDYKKIAGMGDSKKTNARPAARKPLRREKKMKMKKGGIARGCGVVVRRKVTKYPKMKNA